MLIFDENNDPIIIDNINGPVLSNYFWVLDLDFEGEMDFTLTELQFFEEIHCPSLKISIEGFSFFVPSSWNILVMDEETTELDAIQVKKLAGREFTAVVSGPSGNKSRPCVVTVQDYSPDHINVGPLLKKHHMLCHPIGPNEWINIAPSDSHKYLKDRLIGDLF